MKTIYAVGLICCSLFLTQNTKAQPSNPVWTNTNKDSPPPVSEVVFNPPDACSIQKIFNGSDLMNPCSIYGFAAVIPTDFSEPCERDEECPAPPAYCPARADIGFSARWPFGCWPISIRDYSHAHYFAPFLFATFSGTINVQVMGEIIESIRISHSSSRTVGSLCCAANY